MHVANNTPDGEREANPKIGQYWAKIFRFPRFTSITRDSTVRDYRRLSRPVWDLVALALKNAGYGDAKGRSTLPRSQGSTSCPKCHRNTAASGFVGCLHNECPGDFD
jgi:hypothetical protein